MINMVMQLLKILMVKLEEELIVVEEIHLATSTLVTSLMIYSEEDLAHSEEVLSEVEAVEIQIGLKKEEILYMA